MRSVASMIRRRELAQGVVSVRRLSRGDVAEGGDADDADAFDGRAAWRAMGRGWVALSARARREVRRIRRPPARRVGRSCPSFVPVNGAWSDGAGRRSDPALSIDAETLVEGSETALVERATNLPHQRS